MWNGMIIKEGISGFGQTEDEANEDALINRLRRESKSQLEEPYLSRKEELYPWFPLSNMLHISGVGCLIYENNTIWNTRNNKSVVINESPYFMCEALQALVGADLSYTDVVLVLEKELGVFFTRASSKILPIEEYPSITVLESINGFEPNIIYSLNDGDVLVGVSATAVGLKEFGDEKYYVVPLECKDDLVGLVSYLAYRVGTELEV